MLDWLQDHRALLVCLTAASAFLFVATLFFVPALITRIPAKAAPKPAAPKTKPSKASTAKPAAAKPAGTKPPAAKPAASKTQPATRKQ